MEAYFGDVETAANFLSLYLAPLIMRGRRALNARAGRFAELRKAGIAKK